MKTIALHYSFFSVGGIEQVIACQADLFAALGHKVFLFLDRAPTEDGRKLLPAGLETVVLPENRRQRDAALAREMKRRGAEVFYEHAFQMVMSRTSPAFGDLLQVKDVLGLKYVLHWHSNATTPFMDYAPPGDVAMLKSEFAPRIDCLCALSHAMESFFRSFGINAHYVPNRLARNEGRLAPHDFSGTVLWLGRMTAEKRPADAVRAFAELKKSLPTARMVMVGGGDALTAVKALAARLGVSDSIEFVGLRLDVGNFYSRADVFLATSAFEGYPVAQVEAMSFGLPIVAYELSYIEPFAGNGGVVQVPSGDVAALAAALARTLASGERLKTMAAAARARFDELQAFDQAAFYSKVLSGDARPESRPIPLDEIKAVGQMVFDAWIVREKRAFGALKPLLPLLLAIRAVVQCGRLFCFTRAQKMNFRNRRRAWKLLVGAIKSAGKRGDS